MADLGAIEEDVPFDNAAADTLIADCNAAATAIDGQSGGRSGAVRTASTDFTGRFSRVFAANAVIASGDAAELAARLRQVATGAQNLKDEAAKEQKRREVARTWKRDQDNRSLLEQGKDALFGGDDPPVGPPADPPTIPAVTVAARPRQTPPSGASGGDGGGTTSARPSDLRTFATTSKHLDDALRSTPAKLRGDYADFCARCHWGTLDASGVFAGYTQWLSANDDDVTWATAVANAFKAAGGEGDVSTLSNSSIGAALKAAGVSVNRTDLTIDPPQAFGHPPTTGYANDPVNTSTGNFLEVETDVTFPGAAAMLQLVRCYNSFDSSSSVPHAFGPGWASICEAGLAFDDVESLARLTLPDGRQIHFPRLGQGWDRAVGENLWLTADPQTGELVATGNDGAWWRLSAAGVLLSYGTGPRESQSYVDVARDESGRVARLTQARGQWVELDWDGDHVTGARTADGRTVAYGYDEAGQLRTVTGPAGTRSYGWNTEGLIATVTDADGVVEAENAYDDRRRVVSQRSPFGRVTRFVYLPGRVTVVSDEDGTRSNTWIADDKGRLVGVVDAEERRQSTSYDRWGNVVVTTERDGATTVHEYDGRGRRVRTVTPTGADVTYGYDELDRVTTVVTEQGAVTGYAYADDQRNPSTITDPEGGVTRLTWTDGLLAEVVDPTDVVVRFSYDEHGDLVGTTNADGQTARLERDELGRVTAAVSPSGHRTGYEYSSGLGTLTARVDPDGSRWRFEYSSAGRLTATVDPLGGRASVEYGEHGKEQATVDPLGRAIARTFDELGNLSSVTLPDGSRWAFAHDSLSRLVATTDPTGATWSQSFDEVGRLVASADPTGVRVGVASDPVTGKTQVADAGADGSSTTAFDPLGRLTSVSQLDGSAAVYTYDRCGRPTEALDGEGGLTVIRRDAAGRPVSLTMPSGATTQYAYDACGRLATVIDPLDHRVEVGYDADGHAVEQRLANGEVARSTFDVCGRLVAHTAPGVGTSRWTYDLAGRVVGWQNPQTGQRSFRYDDAGQLVAATDGNGRTTSYEYDLNGRAVVTVDPAGGITRRSFDAMNRCVSETDPLGRTTSAGYDATGRIVWQESPDGKRTTWTYDAAGRPESMAVDGRTVTALTRDLRHRTVRITDTLEPGRTRNHLLEWNPRGQLVRRDRDGQSVTWTYDVDGHRTAMTTPDGSTVRYEWDAAGRLTSVDHSKLGRAAFDRDAAGRLVSAIAGPLIQSWEHRDGFVIAHSVTGEEGVARTSIERDEQGRVSRVRRGEGADRSVTTYGYDSACQLIEMRVEDRQGTATSLWSYDAAGRLVTETVDSPSGGSTLARHVFDAAGQLLSTEESSGLRTGYTYDEAGRRLSSASSDGRARTFRWNPTGYLAGVVHHDGKATRTIEIGVDALGELADVDGTTFFWDTAAYAGAPVLIGETPILSVGPITGVDDGWTAPGWRTARANGSDPWRLGPESRPVPGLGDASVGSSGSISLGGLEWMGARVYDPDTRGFLSVDPRNPVSGSGWAGNPYSFAGNDPLHAVDPSGLRPVTDSELEAYRNANSGLIGGPLNEVGNAVGSALDATGHWLKNNWEYVAGGAMVIAGGALMITGVGGPAGAMLISAGADTIIQKATTGHVNWGEVAVSGAAGAVGFGVGGAVARTAVGTGLRGAIITGAAGGAAEGAVQGGGSYLTAPGPHSVTGLVNSTATGATIGGLTGGAGGAAGHGVGVLASRTLDNVGATPLEDAGLGATRGGSGEAYAREVVQGGRADGETVFSGHGEYRIGTGDTVVPEGTTVHVYSRPDGKLADAAAHPIENGTGGTPTRTYGPGESIPDYHLKAPDGLRVYSGSTTVENPTQLSTMLKPGMGNVHWAACTETRY